MTIMLLADGRSRKKQCAKTHQDRLGHFSLYSLVSVTTVKSTAKLYRK